VEKTLEWCLRTQEGRNASFSLAAPREDLTRAEVAQTDAGIDRSKIFVTSGGELAEIGSARIVQP